MMKILHPWLTIGSLLLLSACIHPTERATVHRLGEPEPAASVAEGTTSPVMTASEHYAGFRSSYGYPSTFNVWKDEGLLSTEGEKKVVIRLGEQRGVFLINGQVAMDFPVCTGRKGYTTPTGRYHVLEKDEHHRSNIYDCPMPYFMRLTYSGIGMHVGDIYRVPASHGCIRIPRTACEPLFRRLPHGSEVEILP